ncbi:MAG: O-antigen ligase C-terminal domain-containing protein [Burkholderiales bacterium]|nr:O-antigen ligase C-terminal domain-containing protein [Burkholderiales bacterium]
MSGTPGAREVAVFACIALPWLNPFAQGPSAAAQPLLVCWLFASALLLLWRRGDANVAAWAWLVAGLASAGIGLCQYFGVEEFFQPWMNQAPAGEAFANLRQRNQFASLTAIGAIAVLRLLSASRLSLRWAMAAMLVLAAGNAASASRTGFLQLVLITALTIFWGRANPSSAKAVRVCGLALAAYLVAALALPWLQEWVSGMTGNSAFLRMRQELGCSSRTVLWSNVLHLIAQRPLSGWGWGELDFAHYITLYPGARFCDILDNAHNLPLQLAVELGIPFALLACGALAWAALRAAPWRDTDPTRQMAWAILAVILLHSMVEYPLWYGPFQTAACLCIAMLWPAAAGSQEPVPARLLLARVLLAAACAGAVAFALWDYNRVTQLYLAPASRDAAYRENTLEKVGGSPLFQDQARFAELTTTPLTPANAALQHAQASALLHFSPEPRIVERVIESATLLHLDDEAVQHLARYRAAFPREYQLWSGSQTGR